MSRHSLPLMTAWAILLAACAHAHIRTAKPAYRYPSNLACIDMMARARESGVPMDANPTLAFCAAHYSPQHCREPAP